MASNFFVVCCSNESHSRSTRTATTAAVALAFDEIAALSCCAVLCAFFVPVPASALSCCSRLYTRVLNHYHWVQSCSSFNNTLNNSGLVGIQGSSEPNRAQQMLDIMCSECLHNLQANPLPD